MRLREGKSGRATDDVLLEEELEEDTTLELDDELDEEELTELEEDDVLLELTADPRSAARYSANFPSDCATNAAVRRAISPRESN